MVSRSKVVWPGSKLRASLGKISLVGISKNTQFNNLHIQTDTRKYNHIICPAWLVTIAIQPIIKKKILYSPIDADTGVAVGVVITGRVEMSAHFFLYLLRRTQICSVSR